MSLKEFLNEWKEFGLKVAVHNWIMLTVMHLLGAEGFKIRYKREKRKK